LVSKKKKFVNHNQVGGMRGRPVQNKKLAFLVSGGKISFHDPVKGRSEGPRAIPTSLWKGKQKMASIYQSSTLRRRRDKPTPTRMASKGGNRPHWLVEPGSIITTSITLFPKQDSKKLSGTRVPGKWTIEKRSLARLYYASNHKRGRHRDLKIR